MIPASDFCRYGFEVRAGQTELCQRTYVAQTVSKSPAHVDRIVCKVLPNGLSFLSTFDFQFQAIFNNFFDYASGLQETILTQAQWDYVILLLVLSTWTIRAGFPVILLPLTALLLLLLFFARCFSRWAQTNWMPVRG